MHVAWVALIPAGGDTHLVWQAATVEEGFAPRNIYCSFAADRAPLNQVDRLSMRIIAGRPRRPTWALFMSSSLRPVAYSMAWEAPCDFG